MRKTKTVALKPKREPDGTFWLVWNPGPNGRTPTHPHFSTQAAEIEAKRLAGVCPGEQFVVLKAVKAFKIVTPPPPPVEELPLSQLLFDEIPF